jgi:hypothetical protein
MGNHVYQNMLRTLAIYYICVLMVSVSIAYVEAQNEKND